MPVRHALMTVLAINATALAHRPIFSDGTAEGYESAIPVEDVGLSQVVYHEVTQDSPRVWLTFEGTAGQELYLQIAYPDIPRLEGYRPAVAVLGEGYDPIELPFAVPEGFGGTLLTTDSVAEPEFFHEEFTGTDSQILREETLTLPADGTYYLVAYVPSGETGKLWAAFGKREEFGLSDLLTFSDTLKTVRTFHEVEDEPYALPCFGLPLMGVLMVAGFVQARRIKTRHPGRSSSQRTPIQTTS